MAGTKIRPNQSINGLVSESRMINGKISVSVSSNNLTVALKTLAGADPSSSDPVYVMLDGVIYTITSALSVTKNAGTNYMNAGSSELATKEIDYFVYLGRNATDGVTIGFSRLPFVRRYDGFNTTNTNDHYCAISTITNAAAADPYRVIGRFAATLSAGAGYTWTVPTFTADNLIQEPIFRTRRLSWAPVGSGSVSLTFTITSIFLAEYWIDMNTVWVSCFLRGTTGGTTSVEVRATIPLTTIWNVGSGEGVRTSAGVTDTSTNTGTVELGGTTFLTFRRADGGNWGLGTLREVSSLYAYKI